MNEACELSIHSEKSAELTSMGGVTVAMLGARMHYAVPRLLHEIGLLEYLFTDAYMGNKPVLRRLFEMIPERMYPNAAKRLMGRYDSRLPPEKIKSFDALGLWYAWALARAKDNNAREELYVRAAISFGRGIKRIGFKKSAAVFAYNSAALEIFEEAKKQRLPRILEQTILPKVLEERLTREEFARWPGWEVVPGMHRDDSRIAAREKAEWALADAIVVGSEFVAAGLRECGVSDDKIHVIPYGVDAAAFTPKPPEPCKERPLRLAFVGHVCLRKGIPDLVKALEDFSHTDVEVRIVGDVQVDPQKLASLGSHIMVLGRVPRSDIPMLYAWADVLVMPSIVEGSATVTYEALMSGIPVIATPNAGSVVRDGIDGLIVPIRSPDALAASIHHYVADRDLLAKHQLAAADGRARVSLDRYRVDLSRLFHQFSDDAKQPWTLS